ncbi:MAG TPA: NAD-dependent epimerase/dehydratase family protein, partial [Streptosporangiaceae bacterium]|nr:NAD-dependent epimerase/dehydratase family protein [Streptosporangiaceae bacterium]
APDFAGPTAYPMADLLRGYLSAVGRPRPLMPVHLPGKIARAVKDGANLPAANATLGHRTWEEFLAEQKA